MARQTKERLTLHAYWEKITTPVARRVCLEVGTSWAYFKDLAYGTTRMSPVMMERFEAAAVKVTPGIVPDYELCTRPSLQKEIVDQKKADKAAGIVRGRRIVGAASTGKEKPRPVRRSAHVVLPGQTPAAQ